MINPRPIPVLMLKLNGIIRIVRIGGAAQLKSLKSRSTTSWNMTKPDGNERGRDRGCRHHEDKGSQKEGEHKANCRGDRGQPRAATCLNASRALDVADDGRSPEERANDCCGGIRDQSSPDAGDVAIRIHNAGAPGHTDQCSKIVEQIYQQKSKDNWPEPSGDQ